MTQNSDNWFLADDFSGALEVGAVWRKFGKSVNMVFDSSLMTDERSFFGISSETRNATTDVAEIKVTQILKDSGDLKLRFKKIDSTMRGPVGAELNAIAGHYPGRCILFTPANPNAGRVVKDGCLLVDGVPVSQTPFGLDLSWPVTEDCIQTIVANTGGPQTTVVSFESGKLDYRNVRQKLETGWKKSQVLIVDAVTMPDLERVVYAARDIAPDFLPCGSGGLASALDGIGLLAEIASNAKPVKPKRGRILMVVGSLHPQSRNQIKYCARQTEIPIEFISLESEVGRLSDRLQGFQNAKALILASEYPSVAERLGVEQIHRHADHLADLTKEIYSSGQVDVLFATGGETARAIIDRLDCKRLELEDEFKSGVAVATMTDINDRKATLIVKPGGFGDRELLAQILSTYGIS